jgi:hypothetical protein
LLRAVITLADAPGSEPRPSESVIRPRHAHIQDARFTRLSKYLVGSISTARECRVVVANP